METYFVELTAVGKSHLNKEEINTDNLQADEAIIAADYSLISAGTELSRAFALKKGFSYPVRPGYSTVGRILSKGEKIEAEVGDLVFVNCPHASLIRYSSKDEVQGPLILKLPADIDEVAATFINLFLVALQGVNLSDVKVNQTVGVFGLGNIGIITALIYQKLGCKVIGLDPVVSRCKLAEELGIRSTISDTDQKAAIYKISNGLDIAVDATGLSPVIISAVDCTKNYGQVVLLGSPRQSYECDITPLLSMIHMKDLKVLGAFNNTIPVYPQNGSDDCLITNFNTACDLIREFDVRKFVSAIIDPRDCEKAYYDLMYNKDSSIAVVFDWTEY